MSGAALAGLLVACAAYVGWVVAAVMVVRPRIARRVGGALRTEIRLGRLGHWEAPGAPPGRAVLVAVADLVVLIALSLGPLVALVVVVWLTM